MAINTKEVNGVSVGKGLSIAEIGRSGPSSIVRLTLGVDLVAGRDPVAVDTVTVLTRGVARYFGTGLVSVVGYDDEGQIVERGLVDRSHVVEVTAGSRYCLNGLGDVYCQVWPPFEDGVTFRQELVGDDEVLF